jgi:hypothetical protein
MPYATLEEVWGNSYKNSNSNSNLRKKKKKSKKSNNLESKELEQYYNNLEINEEIEEFQNFQQPVNNITDNITDNINDESNDGYINYDQQPSNLEQPSFSGLEYNTDNYQSLDDQEYEKQNDVNNINQESEYEEINQDNINLNDRISQLEEKINLILEKIEDQSYDSDNNINDIILFLIFGVIFIVILDMMFRFAHRINPHSSKL